MVNVPGRSKGCLRCRQRKIKCDESLPQCLQCLGMRLPCPGARTGAFFVHTVIAPSSQEPAIPQILVGSDSRTILPSNVGKTPDTPPDLSPLSLIQPSRAHFFDRLFVTHFIESFGNLKTSVSAAPSPIWLDELPVLIASPLPSLAQDTIRAGSMLHYGIQARHASIQMEARQWYARALQGLRHVLLQGVGTGDRSSSFNEGAICAALMLSHFETVAKTSLGAWLKHVDGASMMLETLGPERCRVGFMNQLFRHLRLLTFVAMMTRNKSHAFASQQWMAIPFQKNPKTLFDLLVDILLSLLPCLTVADRMIESSSEEAATLMPELRTLIQNSVSQMDLWSQAASELNSGESCTHACSSLADYGHDSLPYGPKPFQNLVYHDLPTAALSALYDTANVIIFNLLFFISPFGDRYEERIQVHAQSIISASEFIYANYCSDSLRGSLMMLFPLKVASIWSSSPRQRIQAMGVMQELNCNEQLNDMISDGVFEQVATHISYQAATKLHWIEERLIPDHPSR